MICFEGGRPGGLRGFTATGGLNGGRSQQPRILQRRCRLFSDTMRMPIPASLRCWKAKRIFGGIWFHVSESHSEFVSSSYVSLTPAALETLRAQRKKWTAGRRPCTATSLQGNCVTAAAPQQVSHEANTKEMSLLHIAYVNWYICQTAIRAMKLDSFLYWSTL